MVVFFDVGLATAAVFVLALVFAQGSSKWLLENLWVICLLFDLKNLVQDIVWGMIKRREVAVGAVSIPLDFFRVLVFYHLLYTYTSAAVNCSGGLWKWLGSLFSLLIVVVIGGGLFLLGEFWAMYQYREDAELDGWSGVLLNIVCTGIFFLFSWWCFHAAHVQLWTLFTWQDKKMFACVLTGSSMVSL